MTYIDLVNMMKIIKIFKVIFIFFCVIFYYACSSGEYDIDKYTVKYTEKTVKLDTIRKITFNEDNIKQDKNNKENIKDPVKESYTYTIQIGAFAMNENSDRFTNIAKQILGDEVYTEITSNLHKIRIGKFSNRAEAIKYIDFVRSKGYLDAFIITKRN